MMKASIIKKMLTGALAVSLVMAPVMSVGAATITGETESIVEEIVEQAVQSNTSGERYDPEAAAAAAVQEAIEAAIAAIPRTSEVAGVKSSTPGTYMATSVAGSAVSTEQATISESYGLTGSEKPYTKFSDLDVKKSPLAKQAIDEAASSQGAEIGPMVNIELGKMSAGKYSLLPSDGENIRIALGIPKNFANDGKTFAVVCVRAGGVVTILEDVDDDPNTVTFDTTGGAGTYAIIRY